MSARQKLTATMRGVLERMDRAGRPPLHSLSPELARQAYEAGANVLEVPTAPLARVGDFCIPARDGSQLRARLYAPSADPLPVLLYFHGGGFTIGSVASHDVLCRELCRLSRCAMVSLDYRLAPEHRFPFAVNDALDALGWLHGHAGTLGLDGSRLAVGGDSAGGTLAAVSALWARDHGVPLALQLLFYPGVSATQHARSHTEFARGVVLGREEIEWFFAQYIDPADRHDWRFAPLEAAEHEGAAPAWIGLAECDPLVDDGIAYADKLRASRVPVDLEIYRGVTHEFIKMGRVIPQARQAHRDASDAIRKALRP